MPVLSKVTTVRVRRDVVVRARLGMGWTKADFARAMGVPQNAVTRIENNGPVGAHLIKRIADTLQLAIDDFVIIQLAEESAPVA